MIALRIEETKLSATEGLPATGAWEVVVSGVDNSRRWMLRHVVSSTALERDRVLCHLPPARGAAVSAIQAWGMVPDPYADQARALLRDLLGLP